MNSKNPYGYLKTECLADVEPVDAQSAWTVTDSREEQVIITTSLLPDGSWVYGYTVYWKNGRISTSRTTAQNGMFRTQREAKLYAIGFMLMFLEYFTEDTRAALLRGESTLLQASLF